MVFWTGSQAFDGSLEPAFGALVAQDSTVLWQVDDAGWSVAHAADRRCTVIVMIGNRGSPRHGRRATSISAPHGSRCRSGIGSDDAAPSAASFGVIVPGAACTRCSLYQALCMTQRMLGHGLAFSQSRPTRRRFFMPQSARKPAESPHDRVPRCSSPRPRAHREPEVSCP